MKRNNNDRQIYGLDKIKGKFGDNSKKEKKENKNASTHRMNV